MKWYDKDKRTMIDIDKVYSYFHYNGYLNINCFGHTITIREDEAEEIWALLKNHETYSRTI